MPRSPTRYPVGQVAGNAPIARLPREPADGMIRGAGRPALGEAGGNVEDSPVRKMIALLAVCFLTGRAEVHAATGMDS